MRHKTYPIVLGLLLTIFAYLIQMIPQGRSFVARFENIAYDMRLKLTPAKKTRSDKVVIVDVDEKSLQQEGRWPWPRNKLAALVKALREQGAAVIAFDVFFPEHENNIVTEIIQKLSDLKETQSVVLNTLKTVIPYFDNDILLAEQFKKSDVVLGNFFSDSLNMKKGLLGQPIKTLTAQENKKSVIPEQQYYLGNIDLFQFAAKYAGFTTTIPDSDGLIRRSPLLIRYQNRVYPSLALEAIRVYLLANIVDIHTVPVGDTQVVESLKIGGTIIPTDAVGQLLIPFLGPQGVFNTYSATDVLHQQLNKNALSGALVFVGSSSVGLGDTHAIPLQSAAFPGVEVHATIANAILNKNFLHIPDWSDGLLISLIIMFGFIYSFLFPFLSFTWISLLGFLGIGGLLGLNTAAWILGGIVFPEALIPMALILLLMILNLAYGYLVELNLEKKVKEMFGRYVPPEHITELLESQKQISMAGTTKELTALFSDIRHFTTLSENLDAVSVSQLLNTLFTPLTKIIFEHRGTVDKYVGDMIMAFWGAPLEDAEHSRHGVEAALEMQKKVAELQPIFDKMGLEKVTIGIGLNTGEMHVGDMGSQYRQSYTILGDNVNLASRLESLTKFYHAAIIVSESTKNANGHIVFRLLDKVKVKGKNKALAIYEPLCLKSEASAELLSELTQYADAMKMYFTQQWIEARDCLNKLSAAHPAVYVYQLYLTRIEAHIKNPPGKEWDGVFVQLEK